MQDCPTTLYCAATLYGNPFSPLSTPIQHLALTFPYIGCMIDHDGLFKQLISSFFLEFVELFFPDLAELLEPNSITFLEKEIFLDLDNRERLEIDLIAKVRLRGQQAFLLVHVENQSYTESQFNFRTFRYFAP
jgi:predicted transposase YdaD